MRKHEEPVSGERKKTKVKRKRKPMTPEQKAAAAQRLAVARAARGPAKNVSLHESIRELPDDHYLSPKSVKEWIKVWQDRLKGMKQYKTSKDRTQRGEYITAETYLKNLKSYLQNGIWSDSRYGEDREHQTKFLVVAPAYDADGNVKRTKGFFYKDYGYWDGGDTNET